ncbi:MAG: glycosyltransferase [Intrasporangium sp.]|uniref:glycosyltransferase n=1 Tax=Intrasporangium sp. TaxID=1925024 RepID=UPI00264875B7|nr:glycosyltransferase [Intrasporangium sp.]MDN5794462.1 glycosyltransferase [Intrasporangium sp.]
MSRHRILCISLSPIARDGRVLRQLGVLTEHGDVTTVGFGPTPDGVAEHLEVPPSATLPQTLPGVARLGLRRYAASELAAPAVQHAIRLIGESRFDLVVANEARALGLAFAVSRGAPVWGDMHEWAPGERDQVRLWRLLVAPFMDHLCRTYLPACAAVTTVSLGIVDEYERVYGVRTELVRNARPWVDLTPTPVVGDGPLRLVHSGGAEPGRRIDRLIDTARMVPNATLDLYLVPANDGGKHLAELREQAAAGPGVTIHDPVAPSDLPRELNGYDVGIFPLVPQNFNMEHTLPNKLFDFLQARLAMAVTPNSEMRRFVSEHGLGVVSDDFSPESFAAALGALTPERVRGFKESAHRQARALSNSTDVATSRAIVDRLLAR